MSKIIYLGWLKFLSLFQLKKLRVNYQLGYKILWKHKIVDKGLLYTNIAEQVLGYQTENSEDIDGKFSHKNIRLLSFDKHSRSFFE